MRAIVLPALSVPGYSMHLRRPWQYLILAGFVLLVFHGLSAKGSDSVAPLPQQAHSAATLRPGQFVDLSRQRKVPGDAEEPGTPYEPEGLGTLHDQRDDRFYSGGLLSLTTQTETEQSLPEPVVYDPYPNYNTREWRKTWRGDFEACEGPRGTTLNRSSPNDMVSVYQGSQKDFPYPAFGSHEALGLDANVCVDRCSRFGPYGHKETRTTAGCPQLATIPWAEVNWGKLQAQCAQRNAKRYKDVMDAPRETLMRPTSWVDIKDKATGSSWLPQYHPRTAVIVRSWHTMDWTDNHRQYLRSLIMELSLHSGTEYQVFLLVDVKEDIDFSDQAAIQRLKDNNIPTEFHDITVLFGNKSLEEWYPNIDEHTPLYQHLQPVQIFSQLHPHFDFYWQFEMGSRNTGHAYHFLQRASEFAKQQPRKYLWERNAFFYTPHAHGTWDHFVEMVDRSMVGKEARSVWGPVAVTGIKPVGPKPPVQSPKDDDYQWGVGEDADLITLLPIFEARQTKWTFLDKIWGLPGDLPRRASPITTWRMSRRLLTAMHKAQNESMAVVSEMSGPTWALLHGLKAVQIPHPIYVDGQWSGYELARAVNRGRPELMNGGHESVWNRDHSRDHILFRMSYMFTTQLAEDIFRRFLGYPADPHQYTNGSLHRDPQGRFWYEEGKLDEEKYGRLCFPPMIIHAVKNTGATKGKDMAVPI